MQRAEHLKDFQRDGFLVVKNLFTPQEVAALKEEAVAIVRGGRGRFPGFIPFQRELRDSEVLAQYTHVDCPHKVSAAFRELAMGHPKVLEVLTSLIGPNVKGMASRT